MDEIPEIQVHLLLLIPLSSKLKYHILWTKSSRLPESRCKQEEACTKPASSAVSWTWQMSSREVNVVVSQCGSYKRGRILRKHQLNAGSKRRDIYK